MQFKLISSIDLYNESIHRSDRVNDKENTTVIDIEPNKSIIRL
jgi:hypothetical protein